MVLLIIIPTKWLFHWGALPHFQTNHICPSFGRANCWHLLKRDQTCQVKQVKPMGLIKHCYLNSFKSSKDVQFQCGCVRSLPQENLFNRKKKKVMMTSGFWCLSLSDHDKHIWRCPKIQASSKSSKTSHLGLSENVGYIPNEIAI